MNLPHLGGEQRCCFEFETAATHCGQPATVHVLLDAVGAHTLSCRVHAGWWQTHEHRDQHPIMAVCGLPATSWVYGEMSEDGCTPSRCAVDGLGELAGNREASAGGAR